jgi:tetratricopeptide (TPR) repeat protein
MWLLALALLAQSMDYQTEGTKALDAKQYSVAAELFERAVAADPKDYGAQFQLALADSLLGKDSDAIAHYKTVLDLKPDLYQAQLNLGILLVRGKEPAAAVPLLQSAEAQKPKEFRPAFYLADALLATGQLDQAAAAYSTALELNPSSAAAESGLGHALARQGHRTEAEPHYRKAAALEPAYSDTLLELASLYEANHQPAEAIAIYREFPQNVAAQERMGALLTETGHASDAIAALEAVVTKSPTDANRLALAQAYVKGNQPGKAAPLVAQVVAAQPRDPELRMFYGRLLRDEHKPLDAAQQFSAAVQLKPDSVEGWNELAGVLSVAEQWPQTIVALDRVRALHAETAGDLFFRAIAYDHMKVRKDALESYRRFLELSEGKNPNQEFQARQRIRIIQHELDQR